jgi:glycosyltransferase involved in cell wall biosynthesis
MSQHRLSIVLPSKNEAAALPAILAEIRKLYPTAEIIVVSDGSTDGTTSLLAAAGVRMISHPYSMGNGAAVKTGARAATGELLVLLDADGQHNPKDIPRLISKLEEGYDMVVGARDGRSQASAGRWFANTLYKWLASWMVGQRVVDLTSGFRVARTNKFREFLHLLPNGFSYPTTITISFFRAGYSVAYMPTDITPRQGKSHIRWRDAVRFFVIIFRVGTLYSPLKLFLPISFSLFLLGIGYYAYTFTTAGRFTNMSALLLLTSVLVFLIGIVSEQITNLLYSHHRDP